jgi:Amt family ammonium transporter
MPWHILGGKGFMWAGLFDAQVMAFFMFQMVFMDTAATIPTGSMAERIKWGAFVWMSFFLTMITYPIIGCWVWGGGWLSQIGAKWTGQNFAFGNGAICFSGSGVIHMVGGWTALVGAYILGPRLGKYDKNGNARPIPGHDIPMAILGTIILFFGWFGFNPGSTLAATDFILPVAAVNTMIAGAFGGFSTMLYMMYIHPSKKPDPGMCCNGILAGLVAITSPCAYVSPTASVIIGLVAGVLVVLSVGFVENKLKIDDPVGAFSVHGVNGVFGVLCVGLFACGAYGGGTNGVQVNLANASGAATNYGVLGLIPIGAPEGTPWGYMGQMKAQILFILADIATVVALEFTFFKVYDMVFGLRVKREDELQGLDIPETGCPAYPNWPIHDAPGLATDDGPWSASPANAVAAEPRSVNA